MVYDLLRVPITTWCNENGASDTYVLENASSAESGEDVSSAHSTIRISPDAWNSNRSKAPLSVKTCWGVQSSPTRIRMDYQCFCSTLASMFPNFLLLFCCDICEKDKEIFKIELNYLNTLCHSPLNHTFWTFSIEVELHRSKFLS